MREVASTTIIGISHTSIKASRHKEVLDEQKKYLIGLVLMGIEMPKVNGFELTGMISEQYPQ